MIPRAITRVLRAGWLSALLVTGPVRSAAVSFVADVAPILQQRCLTCHRESKAKGRYRLDTFRELMLPGAGGDLPVVAGDPAGSGWMRLIRTTDADDRMPQDADPLPAPEQAVIERWISEGAVFDGGDAAVAWTGFLPSRYPEPPPRYAAAVAVSALAFSPDGSELATGGYHEVLVWGAQDGVLRRRLKSIPQRVRGLAWHPGGVWMAVAGGSPGRSGEAILLEAAGGAERRSLLRTADEVLAVAFHPDGGRLATGGTDGAIDVFTVPGGERLLHLAHHADWVQAVAWDADGERFASASRDRTARVASSATGEGIASFTGHGAPVGAVGFSGDGRWVWSGGRDGVLRAWDSVESDPRRTLAGTGGEILGLAVLEGRVLTVAADGRLRIHAADGNGGPEIRATDAARLEGLAVSTAGSLIAAGSDDGRVWLWRLDTPGPVRVWSALPGSSEP